MTKSEVKNELEKRRDCHGRHLMATAAYHQLGDISRSESDLCYIGAETDDYWIGAWVFGFGFFNVLFPKHTTRPLKNEEMERFNSASVRIGSQPPFKLKIE